MIDYICMNQTSLTVDLLAHHSLTTNDVSIHHYKCVVRPVLPPFDPRMPVRH